MSTKSKYWISACLLLFSCAWSYSQSIPPGQLQGAFKSTPDRKQARARIEANNASGCDGLANIRWYFPLWSTKSHPVKDDTVSCFYQSGNTVTPVNQVQFLYGFGGGNSKTLSSDLVSVQFHNGLQGTLGSSVTIGTSTTETQTTTTTTVGGTQQSQSTLTRDTPDTTISKLQAGGDLFFRLDYPILYGNGKSWGGVVFVQPKVGGNFSGFGSQATITEANEYNVNTSVEAYGEWRAIGNAGSLYADIRTGWQHIQPEVAQQIGLGSQNNFAMTQFAAGVEFAGLVRFGFQRFAGPAPAFNVTTSQLSRWHLVMSLVPKKKS